ncbi:MAG: relaxase/mobilization nuclease domain-containing protein [Clostridia bacterium]|nr:relaxase/mobilization nuclease domain-containing protein [Clostridia bacterium]
MIFKIKSNKEDPYKGLAYILRKDKVFVLDGVRAVGTYYLNGMNAMRDPGPADFARQFRKTKEHWGKGNRENELQFFHIKISPNPKDFVCADALLGCAREICDTLFPEFESVISVHNDTRTMHAHIIVNSVNCVTGRHLHYAKFESTRDRMNDRAQHIGLKYGFSLTDKTPARDRKSAAQQGMEKRGIKTDKERLKKILLKAAADSTSEKEFVRKVQAEGVEMPKCDLGYKDFKYFMPGWKRNTRGASMGADYSKTALEEIYIGNAWAAYQNTVPEGEQFISKMDYIDIVRYGLDPVALGVEVARNFHAEVIEGIYVDTEDAAIAKEETKAAPAAYPRPVQETVEIPTPAAVPEPAKNPATFVTHVQPEEVVPKPIREPAPMPTVKPDPYIIPAPVATPAPKPISENVPIAAHMGEEEISRVVAEPLNYSQDEYIKREFPQMTVWAKKSTQKLIFEHSMKTIKNYSEAIFAEYEPYKEELTWKSRCSDYEWETAKKYVEWYKKMLDKLRQEQQEKAASQQPTQPTKKKDDGFYK